MLQQQVEITQLTSIAINVMIKIIFRCFQNLLLLWCNGFRFFQIKLTMVFIFQIWYVMFHSSRNHQTGL